MNARALKAVLDCLPDDCMELPVMLNVGRFVMPAEMLLIDPPRNLQGVEPKLTLTDSRAGETNPEIIARALARK